MSRRCGRRARPATPDPVEAARIAEAAGASGITVHLRVPPAHPGCGRRASARRRARQAQPGDVDRRGDGEGRLADPAAPGDAGAGAAGGSEVTLVPERPEEVTTEGGLNLILYGRRIADVADRLAAAGIAVSLFVDPTRGRSRRSALSRSTASPASRSTPTPTPAPPSRRPSCSRSPRRWSRGGRWD